MADRVEIFDVECPANTTQAAPIEVATPFDPGTVEKVWVVIPDGHSGLTGIALMVGHETVVPFNRRATPTALRKFIEGNDESIPFDLDNLPDSGAWSALLFNTDLNAHQWQLRFEINELGAAPAVAIAAPAVIPAQAIEGAAAPEAPVSAEAPEAPPGEVGETGAPEAPPEATAPEAPPEAPPSEGPAGTEAPAAPAPEGPETGEPPAAPVEGAPPPEGPEAGEAPEGPGPGSGPSPGKPGSSKPHGTTKVRTRTVTTHETRPAGGWLPHGARYDERRVDQGQDFITGWGGPIIAAGDGYVVHNLSDKPFPGGFGPHYAVVHIDTGPFAGHDWYIGHCTSTVSAGEHFKEGHQLARADQGHVEGGGWCELGEAPGGTPGPMGTGAKWHHLFGTRTITRTKKETVKVKAPAKGKPKGTGKHPSKPGGKHPSKGGKMHPAAPGRTRSGKAPAKRAAGPKAVGRGGKPSGAARKAGPVARKAAARPAPRPASRPAARPPAPAPRRPPPPPPPPARRAAPPPPKRRR